MSPSVTANLLWTQMGTLLLCLFHLLFPFSSNLRTSTVLAAWWEMPPAAVLYSCRADQLLRAPIPITWLVPIWRRNWVIKAFWGSCVFIHNCFRGNPFQAEHVHRHSFTSLLTTQPGPVLSSQAPLKYASPSNESNTRFCLKNIHSAKHLQSIQAPSRAEGWMLPVGYFSLVSPSPDTWSDLNCNTPLR